MEEVRAWEEDIIIPTYEIGNPEKNPVFLEKRVYQGSSGVVYPHPVLEKIFDDKKDKLYRACFLENRYIKIMILPELGGRVQMAYDKIKKRHFVYYNRVIKPALVGLTGPWISGGIEFNWPQHHRPSTFQPVDYTIEENPDGSKTVWCSEVERMFRTKGMSGFTLSPQYAYLEIRVKLYNRTIFPQTFLWWANPAVKVNDDYQSVFPPDVNAVFDHGKRDVSRFPIATGTYYKVDYSAGVDISRYKNIPVPTSYMAINSKYDFVGGYEHDTRAGMLHVASHHISPGKKQWTWGSGDFGKAWDRNLTDEDGPYIELMTGVFTDNQPDFSWIMPFEERSFVQYFMPYSELGLVKNATKEALVNLEFEDENTTIKLYATAFHADAEVILSSPGKLLFKKKITISPESPFIEKVQTDRCIRQSDIEIKLISEKGNMLVSWKAQTPETKTIPEPAQPAKEPAEISSIEQLYLTGLHIEQYRHATYQPTDYYTEALKREPGNIRNNNAMGLWLMRRGQFAKAEPFFRASIKTLTERNPNPYDGEPYYNLGCCLKMQNRIDEAYDAFYKSVWNAAWSDSGYLSIAQIASLKGNYYEALEHTQMSLIRNWHNHKTRHLRTALLRITGATSEALKLIEDSLSIDKFNFGCKFEKWLILSEMSGSEEADAELKEFSKLINGSVHSFIEYALDYSAAGLYHEAARLLSVYLATEKNIYPMVYYLLGYLDSLRANSEGMLANYTKASQLSPDYCFPNRIEEVLVLQNAIKINPGDPKAPYYLGNFWYSNQQYNEALSCWEQSASLDDRFPVVLRNLSLVYYNKKNLPGKAVELLEKAFEIDRSDGRILMELDQLYKKTGRSLSERLDTLESFPQMIEFRDDLYLERITLCNQLGQFDKAKNLLENHNFHPWEGGEGKVIREHVITHLGLAKIALAEGYYSSVLELLNSAANCPLNLGEGKLHGTLDNDVNYYMGCALERLKDQVNAQKCFEKASKGVSEPSQAFFYNDQQSDMIFYQGLALKKLGDDPGSRSRFNKLIDYGEKHLNKKIKIDYFAVSMPDLLIWDEDLNHRNNINCYYLIGLGYLGMGDIKKAKKYLNTVLSLDINHSGAIMHLRDIF